MGASSTTSQRPRHFIFPNRLSAHFVDRRIEGTSVIERLTALLAENENPQGRVVGLLGMGGVGRTQRALRLCERCEARGDYGAISGLRYFERLCHHIVRTVCSRVARNDDDDRGHAL